MHEVPVVEVDPRRARRGRGRPAGREGLAAHDRGHARRGRRRQGRARARRRDRLPRGRRSAPAASWDASTVRLRVPVARLDDALAADGGRRARGRTSRRRSSSAAQGGAHRPPPGPRRARRDRVARARAGRVRPGPPLRPAAGAATRRRSRPSPSPTCARSTPRATRRGARRSSSSGDVDAATSCRSSRRRSARGRPRPPPPPRPPCAAPRPAHGPRPSGSSTSRARRSPRSGSARVGPPARARLRRGRGDEHAPRRLVHLAAQREPARAARLRLRRRLRASGATARAGSFVAARTCRPTRPRPPWPSSFKELERIRTARAAGGGGARAQLRGPRLRRRLRDQQPDGAARMVGRSSTTSGRLLRGASSRRRWPWTSPPCRRRPARRVDPKRMAFVVVGRPQDGRGAAAGPGPRHRCAPSASTT